MGLVNFGDQARVLAAPKSWATNAKFNASNQNFTIRCTT